jgi:hypothetical protein
MKDEKITIRGIDDKRRLLAFFSAKEHKNLVLRVVDVLELRNDEQDYLIRLCGHGMQSATDEVIDMRNKSGWRKKELLLKYPNGWIVLPLDDLLDPMGMDEIAKLQAVIYHYADIRRQKGEPHRVEDCARCGGSGRLASRECKFCAGSGRVYTFIEMSDEEKELAHG